MAKNKKVSTPTFQHSLSVGRVTKKYVLKNSTGVRVKSEQSDWFEVEVAPDSDFYRVIEKAVSKKQVIKFDVCYDRIVLPHAPNGGSIDVGTPRSASQILKT